LKDPGLIRLFRGMRKEICARKLDVSQEQAARSPGRTLRSVAELMDDVGELPPMLIEGLLPDRSLFLLAGKPKAGKSFLALDIADAVCRGVPVLGHYRVNRPGPVVYAGMEDGEIEIVKRLKQRGMCKGDGRDLYYVTDSFILTEPANLAEFRRDVEEKSPSLIVIDTAAEAMGIRDWLNRSEIIEKVAAIRKLAREVCSVLLVAHNRKAEGDGGDEIAGSNAFAAAVDGWISTQRVERRENGNRRLFLRIEGRGGVRGEIVVEMDTNTLGFSMEPPEQVLMDALASQDDSVAAARQPRYQHVRQAIADLGERATVPAIAEMIRFSHKTTRALVRDLIEKGEVEDMGGLVKMESGGRPALTYRLVTREVASLPFDPEF
jgi:predicted ATP-dependent serine protease